MFSGRIKGLGPRYCPSIEDKITRFSHRDRHQIFVEPEGWHTVEVYVNGFSTSLPEDVQLKAMRKIAGFEQVKMFRPGYAIEYDWFPPTQLYHSLETKHIKNLFFAGQINGTTGYEEAAGQGIMAGINAHLAIQDKEPFVLKRSEAYIAVLIDDLVLKGTEEPYRMFTSRAEYRVLLRGDNADTRLTPLGHALGLASDERLKKVEYKNQKNAELSVIIRKTNVNPEEVNPMLETKNDVPIDQKYKALQLLLRPNVELTDLSACVPDLAHYIETIDQWRAEIVEKTQIELKYEGYISKEKELALKLEQLENFCLKETLNYDTISSLSTEGREKLKKNKPSTLGQASRISGVSPSDISILMMHLK
jgi:tRNA uridine 5-carboxymethylaminomethyl modification enzyme